MYAKKIKRQIDEIFSAGMDFMMEALIMSKFQHENIVRFIGVCFDKHPRYENIPELQQRFFKGFLGR